MEQRSLRLGDNVDDYCPRERRITTHAIVALVGEDIRQTRCGTCDAEHEYKGGRMPRRKTVRAGDAAGGVLVAKAANGQLRDSGPEPDVTAPKANGAAGDAAPSLAAASATGPSGHEGHEGNGAAEDGRDDQAPLQDGWLAHRPLIRATLPKIDGEAPPPRAIPEFTMHQRQARGFGRGFRHGGFGGHQQNHSSGNGNNANGNVMPGREPDGNRAPRPGKSRHRRRHRRPR